MIFKYLVLGIVLCGVGCASATPVAAPLTLPPSAPTGLAPTLTAAPALTATPARSDGVKFFPKTDAQLDAYLKGGGETAALYNALARETIRFFARRINATDPLADHSAVNALQLALKELHLPERVTPRVVVIPIGEALGERRDLLCSSFVGMQGTPIVMLLRRGSAITPLRIGMVPVFQAEGQRWAWLKDFTALDVTGDGVKELVFSYIHAGGSNSQEDLRIMRWDANASALKEIFQGRLVFWVGDSTYTFISGEKGNDLELSYPWFGVFSAKMVDHVTATEIWSYDAASDRMVRRQHTVGAARSTRQQVNLAEALFRNGDLEGAVRAYERAASDPTLRDETYDDVVHAARAFARFRQGEILALLGREPEARQRLAEAEQAGGTLGMVVKAFLENYRGEDAALRAWAMLPREIDLAAEIYWADGKSNIDLPARASEIFFAGGVIAAFLNQYSVNDDALLKRFPELGALGFQWHDARTVDWDGDGQSELLVVTHDGHSVNEREVVWLVYRKAGQWRAREIFARWDAQEMQLVQVLNLPARRGLAVGIAWRESKQRHEQRLAWDGTRLQELDFQTLEPLLERIPHSYVGCRGNPSWLPNRNGRGQAVAPTRIPPINSESALNYENEYVVGWLPGPIEF
ncbi:MAG: tetratricopeptide repeat protein [Chloroflexi bacterium]|nr:tetratricopeptide repeat protein [Chloroflexota bacterium]